MSPSLGRPEAPTALSSTSDWISSSGHVRLGCSASLFSVFLNVAEKRFRLNRSVVCWSRRVWPSAVSRSRDPHAASITFQCIPGHHPGRRLHCTSGLPSAGLQHSASVRSVAPPHVSPVNVPLSNQAAFLWPWMGEETHHHHQRDSDARRFIICS